MKLNLFAGILLSVSFLGGLFSVPTIAAPIYKNDKTVIPTQPVTKPGFEGETDSNGVGVPIVAITCPTGKSKITIHFSNSNSSNNFAATTPVTKCILNSSIWNGNNWQQSKAEYIGKVLALQSTSPLWTIPSNLYSPYTINTTAPNLCNPSTKPVTSWLSSFGTVVTIRNCRKYIIGGIGDTARMHQTLQKSLTPIYSGVTYKFYLNNNTLY